MARSSWRLLLLVGVPMMLAGFLAFGAGVTISELASSPAPTRDEPIAHHQQILYATLAAVACPATHECVAVGDFLATDEDAAVGDPDGDGLAPRALVEVGAGANWRVVQSPGIGDGGVVLSGVDCASARECVAVGYYQSSDEESDAGVSVQHPLVESFDGIAWHVVATPSAPPNSVLASVSCPATRRCVAVGYTTSGLTTKKPVESPFVEAETGGTWEVMPDPAEASVSSSLRSVSCASSATCIAVGTVAPRDDAAATRPSTAMLEAGHWRSIALPGTAGGPGALYSVDCTDFRSCIAVGTSSAYRPTGSALVVSWNGLEWRMNSTALRQPGDVALTAVTCVGISSCMATGTSTPSLDARPEQLLARLDAMSWQVLDVPLGPVNLDAIACAGEVSCLIVGSVPRSAFGNTASLIASLSGSSWVREPTPTP